MLYSFKKRNTWDLIWQLFRTDFKLKYNDSFLGFIWVLAKPFSLFLIMYFVLSQIFVNQMQNYPVYLLLGNIFITFWSEGTSQGMESLLARANLITKVNFPRYIVLISSTILSTVNFIINLCLFMIIAYFNNITVNLNQALWFLFCIMCLYLLITGVSMFLSVTYVKFRDLKQIWELFNQLIFWATPVFYTVETLSKKSVFFETLLTKLNPISVLLTSARNALMYNEFTLQQNIFVWFGVILIIGFCGYIYFKRSIKKIAEFF